MEFFITEAQRKQIGGSGYFEFQRGQKEMREPSGYWKEDSLLLHMDIADEIALYQIIPGFQYYGITYVDREKWDIICQNAETVSGKAEKVIHALRDWTADNFREYQYFVILGI